MMLINKPPQKAAQKFSTIIPDGSHRANHSAIVLAIKYTGPKTTILQPIDDKLRIGLIKKFITVTVMVNPNARKRDSIARPGTSSTATITVTGKAIRRKIDRIILQSIIVLMNL